MKIIESTSTRRFWENEEISVTVFNVSELCKAIRELKTMEIPADSKGNWKAFIHPDVEFDLVSDPDTFVENVTCVIDPGKNKLFGAKKPQILGVTLYRTLEMPDFSEETCIAIKSNSTVGINDTDEYLTVFTRGDFDSKKIKGWSTNVEVNW